MIALPVRDVKKVVCLRPFSDGMKDTTSAIVEFHHNASKVVIILVMCVESSLNQTSGGRQPRAL